MNKYSKDITNHLSAFNITKVINLDSYETTIKKIANQLKHDKINSLPKSTKKLTYYESVVEKYLNSTFTKVYLSNKLLEELLSKNLLSEGSDSIVSDNTLSNLLSDENCTDTNVSTKNDDTYIQDDSVFSINEIMDVISDSKYNEANSDNDEVKLKSYTDLVSHVNDLQQSKFTESVHKIRNKKVEYIKSIPQFEQKSKQWLYQRSQCLTATGISVALDEDPYSNPIDLLFDKCGRGKPFIENENVHHGKKYEEIGNMYYAFRNNVNVGEYGLIQHNKFTFIGASPDGICEKTCHKSTTLSKNVGKLLEIKFPKKRKIVTDGSLDGDICPHYYYVQVQTQLFVTDLDECDFLQCEMEEYKSEQEYDADCNETISGLSKKTNLEKGIIIQLLPKKMHAEKDPLCLFNAKYIYPPTLHMKKSQQLKWIENQKNNFGKNEYSDDYFIDRVIYWRFKKIACHLIKADRDWMQSKIPLLKQFWDYVLFYRENALLLDKLIEYADQVSRENSAVIFKRVHSDYVSLNPKSKTLPLYQTETEWRKIYNKKKIMYSKYSKK